MLQLLVHCDRVRSALRHRKHTHASTHSFSRFKIEASLSYSALLSPSSCLHSPPRSELPLPPALSPSPLLSFFSSSPFPPLLPPSPLLPLPPLFCPPLLQEHIPERFPTAALRRAQVRQITTRFPLFVQVSRFASVRMSVCLCFWLTVCLAACLCSGMTTREFV